METNEITTTKMKTPTLQLCQIVIKHVNIKAINVCNKQVLAMS